MFGWRRADILCPGKDRKVGSALYVRCSTYAMRYLSDLAYGAPNQQERFFNGLEKQSVTTREISQGFPADYPPFHTGPPHAALNATASYPACSPASPRRTSSSICCHISDSFNATAHDKSSVSIRSFFPIVPPPRKARKIRLGSSEAVFSDRLLKLHQF